MFQKDFNLILSVRNRSSITNYGKKVYRIDNPSDIHIMYNDLYNDFFITFKCDKKQMCVSCRGFDIIGTTFNKELEK